MSKASGLHQEVGNHHLQDIVVYKAFAFFMTVGLCAAGLGFLAGLRFIYYYLSGDGDGHLQSLILASILLGGGFQTMLTAFLADLLAVNRRLMEDVQYRVKKLEISVDQTATEKPTHTIRE